MGNIFDTLKKIGITSSETREKIASRTRDKDDVTVWRDRLSKVIYIDDFYVGDTEYEAGEYRGDDRGEDFEAYGDARRRLNDYNQHYVDKKICDVGCGAGLFLLGAQDRARSVSGVELQQSYIDTLGNQNIECVNDITKTSGDFDTIFMLVSNVNSPDGSYK